MGKHDYFRTLMVKGDDSNFVIEVFTNMQNWHYDGIETASGIKGHKVQNDKRSVCVIFSDEENGYFKSTHVLPILGTSNSEYTEGYDFSDNQAENLQEDVLYNLCIEINQTSENLTKGSKNLCICGIVPSLKDCKNNSNNI